jgi:hypothetical protein
MSPWVRLDDSFDDDPRVTTAGPAAAGLLTMLLAYSNRNLSDGFVSETTVRQKAGRQAESLKTVMVKVGLLKPEERDGIPGYRIHQDFVRLQPTREQVEAERQAAKARKERWLERQRNEGRTPEEQRSERQSNAAATAEDRAQNEAPDPDPDPHAGTHSERPRARNRGPHAWRGNRMSVPRSLHAQFVNQSGGDAADADQRLREALYAEVDQMLVDRSDVPIADDEFDFWWPYFQNWVYRGRPGPGWLHA